MNVVSVMAHQDDEMNCLGTMLKCRDRGDKLFFITVTDGSGGFVQRPDIPREEAARIRHEEMTALSESLDAGFINLRERDEFLYDTPDLRLRLIEAIRRTRADILFTHYHEDYNLDHTTANSLVRQCAMLSCLNLLPMESKPLPAHPAVFLVRPHGPFIFPASHFVDISGCEEEKIRLLKHHRSQEEAMRLALGKGFDDLCRCPDAYWGGLVNCAFAEPFVPMRSRGAMKAAGVLP
ncbi:MAG: PIG-L family deacetylase [Planctomycetota bacterium]